MTFAHASVSDSSAVSPDSALSATRSLTAPRSFVATLYYEQDAAEGGVYSQMRGDSSAEAFRDAYRRCLVVLFSTARIASPDAELVLVLNRPWRTEASSLATEVWSTLESTGVTFRVAPYSFSPPSHWPAEWRNTFFKFDALQILASMASPEDRILLLDSDVVWSGSQSTSALWARLRNTPSMTLHVDYPVDSPVNGLSRSQMTEFARQLGLGTASHAVLPHSGGELVGLSGDAADALCARARAVWPEVLARFETAIPHGMTEEHLLSMLLADLELPTGNANPFIKRMWTQPLRYRNTVPGDEQLPLWHVPAEKRYGLRRLYAALQRSDSDDRSWATPSVLGPYLGVPANTRRKALSDIAYASISRVRELVGLAASRRA